MTLLGSDYFATMACTVLPCMCLVLSLGSKPMKRREVITLLSGAAAWPLASGAQQPDRVRCIAGSVERVRLFAKELVQLSPEVIFTFTTPATAALQAETSTIPIVFMASDPIGSGFVASLANPGGNLTGFINFEASLGSKWLELLHEVAPRVSRVAFMFNPNTAPYARYYLATFRSAASALAVEPIEAPVYATADEVIE